MPAITQYLILINELLLSPWSIMVALYFKFHLANQESAQLMFIFELSGEDISVQALYVQLCCIASRAQRLRVGWRVEILWKSG